MSKVGSSKEYFEVIRKEILKRDQYKCKSCSIRQGVRVYLNSRKKYVECDEFVEQWAIAHNKKVFTVGLVVVQLDLSINDYSPSNLVSLCTRCSLIFKKKTKKILRKEYSQLIKNAKDLIGVNPNVDLYDSSVLLRAYVSEVMQVELTNEVAMSLIVIINKYK